MAIDELEYKETNLDELIEIVEKDALPTNEFTIQDVDKYVLLGKLNEIEQHLRGISELVGNSDSKANNALEQAIKAVQSATTALDSSNTALDSSNTALATANQAIETANNALQNVVISIDTSNEAKEIAQNALNIINEANTKADNAVNVANSAFATANTANINAFDAQETANNADTKADNAVSVANSANTTANEANTKADNAVSVANSANTTANEAKEIASGANTTANNAKNIADEALSQVVSGAGTKVYAGGTLQSTFNVDTKANQSELNTTNTNVATNTSDIATLKTGKANQSDLNTTNTNVATNTTNIATNTSDIATLKTSKANKDLTNIDYPRITYLLPDKEYMILSGTMDRIIEFWVAPDLTSWYRKWASGWKECGMLVKGDTSWREYYLPVTFNDDLKYIILATTRSSAGCGASKLSGNKFDVKTESGSDDTVSIYCCGY